MEKWRCRGKNIDKVEFNHGTCIQQPSSSLLSSEKKVKKWTLGGLLKRISKNEIPTKSNINEISSDSNYSKNLMSKNIPPHNYICHLSPQSSIKIHNQPNKLTNDYHEKAINNFHVSEHESQDSNINICDPSIHSRNSESSSEVFKGSGGSNNRRNLIKARIKAKRERYCENNSSSDDENYSNSSLAVIQSEDNSQNMYRSDNNRRTRGARTERYMKRLCRDDSNGSNDNHEVIKNNVYTTQHLTSIKDKQKSQSNILSPYLQTINNNSQLQLPKKIPVHYHQSWNHKRNSMDNISNKNIKCSVALHDNKSIYNDKFTHLLNSKCKHLPITNHRNKSSKTRNNTTTTAYKVQPPVPPPRSSKSRLYMSPLNYSIKNSAIENNHTNVNTTKYKEFPHYANVNCNSLDRVYSTTQKNSNHQLYCTNDRSSRHSFSGDSKFSLHNNINDNADIPKNLEFNVDKNCIEAPIVPNVKKIRIISSSTPTNIRDNKLSFNKYNEHEIERKRHSKNLEEALQELEVIYNSLHLNNDDDLLDRAEQRSMNEYRDKIAAAEGSIKNSSDTSSSYDMSNETAWRHTSNFDQCEIDDTRLKDDMAYRRIHQNKRSSSVDPNQMSLSRYSYLASSPILSRTNEMNFYNTFSIDKSKSRRGTPDLMRDDVVFRTIKHANNMLKIIEPQPPFGIPIGPVTTAVESDYLHIEPTRSSPRSLYIPQSEPDVITDDLAFRNLRKDSMKNRDNDNSSDINYLPKIQQFQEMKKKRAVRSLSADLYGIINKSNENQHVWYKEYVKLNRPRRLSDCDGDSSDYELNTNSWISNREFVDLDINGNRPKSTYQGRIQVCIPQDDEKIIEDKFIKSNGTIIDDNSNDEFMSKLQSNIDIQIPNVTNTIESFNDNNELSEYKELCHNLECLINKISEKAKSVDTKSSDAESKSSLDNFVEWNDYFTQNDTRSMEKKSDTSLKSSVENEIPIKRVIVKEMEQEKLEKSDDYIKTPYKLSDNHKELHDSPKNLLTLIITENDEEPKNKDKTSVIVENKCKELNLLNNVPYESSDTTEVMNNKMEIIQNNFLKNNENNDDSSTPIDLKEKKIILKLNDEINNLTLLKPSSTISLLTTNNDDDEEHDDCIHESSIIEGRETSDGAL